MAAGMDMSLDEIIKRSAAARRHARPSHSAPGPDRRTPLRVSTRTTPYSIPQVGRQMRQGSVVPCSGLGGVGVLTGRDHGHSAEAESGTKLYISNLDYGVSNGDIKLLFSEEGELKRYSIHYDKSGRSKGTAEVVYAKQSDAIAAMKKYNNMKLDGKPLQIELVGTNLVGPAPAVVPLIRDSILGRPNNVLVCGQGRAEDRRFFNGIASDPLPRGHGEKIHIGRVSYRDHHENLERHHHRARGHREMKGHTGKVSLKDLDDDLERYHLEAMKLREKSGN